MLNFWKRNSDKSGNNSSRVHGGVSPEPRRQELEEAEAWTIIKGELVRTSGKAVCPIVGVVEWDDNPFLIFYDSKNKLLSVAYFDASLDPKEVLKTMLEGFSPSFTEGYLWGGRFAREKAQEQREELLSEIEMRWPDISMSSDGSALKYLKDTPSPVIDSIIEDWVDMEAERSPSPVLVSSPSSSDSDSEVLDRPSTLSFDARDGLMSQHYAPEDWKNVSERKAQATLLSIFEQQKIPPYTRLYNLMPAEQPVTHTSSPVVAHMKR